MTEEGVEDMTLRDWFAGMALAGSTARFYTPEGAASWADKVADAMMEVRKNDRPRQAD